jgi:hypothetical protein
MPGLTKSVSSNWGRGLLGLVPFFVLNACGVPQGTDRLALIPGQVVTEAELQIAQGQEPTKARKHKESRKLSPAEQLAIQRYSLIGDTDGDGTRDNVDPDIDNDGIPNLADEYPFSIAPPDFDFDKDGVPTWIDADESNNDKFSVEIGTIQAKLFATYKVIYIGPKSTNRESDIKSIKSVEDRLADPKFKSLKPWTESKVIYFDDSPSTLLCGRFDADWRTIQVYRDNPCEVEADITFTHELFHAVHASNQQHFVEFMKLAGWSYDESNAEHRRLVRRQVVAPITRNAERDTLNPLGWFVNPYSKINPVEHFAESATVSFHSDQVGQTQFDLAYPLASDYLKSELHLFFEKLWSEP